MALQRIKIDSILGGISPSRNFAASGQYTSSIGIDPDFPVDDSSTGTCGYLRPTSMAKFSGSEVTGVPLWFVTNPKTSSTYLYANDGKVHTIASNLTMGTALNSGNALTTASGNGAEYYDNYAYFASNTDITRYGPLNGSASLTQNFWSTTLSKTATSNTTYPSLNSVAIPNHPMYNMVNAGKLFFGDVAADNRGVIHFIRTTKTTVEGDTDNGSTHGALYLNYGVWPTCVSSLDTRLVVGAIDGSDTTIRQKNAKLYFWDTVSATWQYEVDLPDPIITAIKNVNGVLWIFSGNTSGGVRVSRYAGGFGLQQVHYLEEGWPPFQGAVDAEMNKVFFGGYVAYPETAAVCFGVGSKKPELGSTSLHGCFKASAAGALPQVTAVKILEQANASRIRPIIGWKDGSAKGLDSISSTYGTSVWRSEAFRVGRPFTIKRLQFGVSQAIASNMTLTVKVFVDDETSSTTLTTINSTNFNASQNRIILQQAGISGNNNFRIELRWTGSALLTVQVPIELLIDVQDD